MTINKHIENALRNQVRSMLKSQLDLTKGCLVFSDIKEAKLMIDNSKTLNEKFLHKKNFQTVINASVKSLFESNERDKQFASVLSTITKCTDPENINWNSIEKAWVDYRMIKSGVVENKRLKQVKRLVELCSQCNTDNPTGTFQELDNGIIGLGPVNSVGLMCSICGSDTCDCEQENELSYETLPDDTGFDLADDKPLAAY